LYDFNFLEKIITWEPSISNFWAIITQYK